MMRYVCTLVMITGCDAQPIPAEEKTETMNCSYLIENKLNGIVYDIDMASCNTAELLSLAEMNTEDALHTTLGNKHTGSAYWEYIKDEANNTIVKIWEQENVLAKIDMIQTFEDETAINHALKTMGVPEKKLDYYFDVLLMKEKAWIYPQQGIALFMGFQDTSVYQVSYFRKTTMEQYEQELHPINQPREF